MFSVLISHRPEVCIIYMIAGRSVNMPSFLPFALSCDVLYCISLLNMTWQTFGLL